jgi:hypothetical protein
MQKLESERITPAIISTNSGKIRFSLAEVLFSAQAMSIYFLTRARRSVTTPAQLLSSLRCPD